MIRGVSTKVDTPLIYGERKIFCYNYNILKIGLEKTVNNVKINIVCRKGKVKKNDSI